MPEGPEGPKQSSEEQAPLHGPWRFTPRTGVGIACLAWCGFSLGVIPRLLPAHPASWVIPVWLVATVVLPWAVWIAAVAHWPSPSEQKTEQKRLASVAERGKQAEVRGRFYHAHGGRCQVCDRAVKESGRNWRECPHCHALVCWTCQKEVVTSAGSHLALCPVCDDLIEVTEVRASTASDWLRGPEMNREAEKRVRCCVGCGAWDEQTEAQWDLQHLAFEAVRQAFGGVPKPAKRIGKVWLCRRCMKEQLTTLLWAAVKDHDPPDLEVLDRWLKRKPALSNTSLGGLVKLAQPCQCGGKVFCVSGRSQGSSPLDSTWTRTELWQSARFAHVCVHCGHVETGEGPSVRAVAREENPPRGPMRGCPLPGHSEGNRKDDERKGG